MSVDAVLRTLKADPGAVRSGSRLRLNLNGSVVEVLDFGQWPDMKSRYPEHATRALGPGGSVPSDMDESRLGRTWLVRYADGTESLLGKAAIRMFFTAEDTDVATAVGNNKATPSHVLTPANAGEVIRHGPRRLRESLGDFARGITNKHRDPVVCKAAMSELTGAAGGFLAPEEVSVRIDEHLREQSVFLARCQRQPMKSASLGVSRFDLTASHATGASPLFAGMKLVPTVEGATVAQQPPSWVGDMLKTRDLMALVYASNQLVADGGEALGTYLLHQFCQLAEWTVEWESINGNGANHYGGFLASAACASVNRAGGGTISAADVANLVASLLPACFKRSIFMCSVTALAKIAALSTFSLNTPIGAQLLTRPLYVTEKLPAAGTRGDLCLVDPTQYVLGERSLLIDEAREEPTAFAQNLTCYRVWQRGDGLTIPRGTFTLADGATTVGAFVALN